MLLDLFAGPGGWEEGLRLAGVFDDVLGIENDELACATAISAGHPRLCADVREVEPSRFSDVTGLLASPPCQTFSQAGPGRGGRATLEDVAEALAMVANGVTCAGAATVVGLDTADPRATLVLEPMRFIRELRPGWVVMENVPSVRKVFDVYARLLPAWGYSCWSGVLNAADYGLPQARRRAFLMATLHGTARPPEPTHSKSGETLRRWVTMAEALDLGERPDDITQWAWDRPSTTVVRSYNPHVISPPGYRRKGDPPRQKLPGCIEVTHEQMMRLQGLRTDYPVHGSFTKRGSLIGAVLPPPWAAAIVTALVEQQPPRTCVECGDDDATFGHAYCSDCLEVVEQ